MSEVIRITPEVVIPVAELEFRALPCRSNFSSRARGAEWPRCSFWCSSTGPFSEVEGLFTELICIPCLEVRQAQPDTLLGFHNPASLQIKQSLVG